MATLLEAIVNSKIYEILSFSLLFSFLLPFVLWKAMPNSSESTQKKGKKNIGGKTALTFKKQEEKPATCSVYVYTTLLYIGFISQLAISLVLKFVPIHHWLFYYHSNELISALAAIFLILFEIVYVWSLILLKPKNKIAEGCCAPTKLVRSGPYSEV